MARVAITALALFLSAGLVVGCGQGDAAATADAKNGAPSNTPQQAPRPSDPVAGVAYDFLSAVLKGDEQQVTACLTAKAAEQLNSSDQRFPMPGVDSTTFQIGEIRKPSESLAFVMCLLNDASKEGPVVSDEICCLLKLDNNQWRVSGLAIGSSQGQPTILDFEAPPSQPMELQTAPQVQDAPAPPIGRPSPPRTANESFPPANR